MTGSTRLGAWCDVALQGLGWLACLGVLLVGLHDASQAFDSWYYHLPFAARLAGLIPASSYAFHPANQARYEGFALLGELLQGALWRVTGRAECANLVAFSSVPLVAWFLRQRWGVPFGLTGLALFAVPLVQTHASSAYVDLPANAAVTVLVLLVTDAFVQTEGRAAERSTDIGLALLAAAVAVNMKPLLQPIVVLALLALLGRTVSSLRASSTRPSACLVFGVLLALPVVFFTPLKNAVVHANPFYPIGLTVLGHALPGPEKPYSFAPYGLEHASGAHRFLLSILEVGVRPLADSRRWSVDQWMPSDSPGSRMGGFCGAYVLVQLAVFGARIARDCSRRTRVSGVAFGVLTFVIVCLPQCHELRYYMCWMVVLVTTNLVLTHTGAPIPYFGLRTLGISAALALTVVMGSTRGVYVFPQGTTVAALVERTTASRVTEIKDGERVCIRDEPHNLLWAAYFHPPHRYEVQEAEDPGDCGALRDLLQPKGDTPTTP